MQLRDQAELALEAPDAAVRTEPRSPALETQSKSKRTEQEKETARAKTREGVEKRSDAAAPPPAPAESEVSQRPRELKPEARQNAEKDELDDSVLSQRPFAAGKADESTRAAPQGAREPAAPEASLKKIQEQYARGEIEQADRALRQFCVDFPGHSLPAELSSRAARLAFSCNQRSDGK
jgi:hypothetical protein